MSLKIFILICLFPVFARSNGVECSSLFIVADSSSRAETAVTQLLQKAGVILNGTNPSDMSVHDPEFFKRLLSDPKFEIGETYMDGMWDSAAIDQLTTKLYEAQRKNGSLKTFAPLWKTPGLAFLAFFKNAYRYSRDVLTNRQTRTRSKKVAEEHYDAGNELYRRMLDPTLTYTSGVWADGYTLEDAQNAKYDLIARKLRLKPGQRVLDIGSGFGGFARFAAKNYGAKVTGITISVEQLKAARALSADFKDVDFVFSDYRDIPHRFPPNTFDHVVSIEMIEAVGPKNLEPYFQSAYASLKDGGRFVIQAIANNKDVYNTNPWFSKYIFSDGVAPSTNQVDRAAKKTFGSAVDRHRITSDYDKTLLAWHENFTRAWPDLKNEYSERFKRMWDFYLLSVAGGFRSKEIQLDQSVFVKGDHRQEVRAVRELPSRERLDAMRATADNIELTAATIADLEVKKHETESSLVPRVRGPQVQLKKDARIAVVGAGPGGLSAALELKKQGYANVVIFDKEAEAGGKSHTVEVDGRPHDLGATMGVRNKYAEIERLAEQNGQKTIPFPEEINYDLQSGAPIATKKADALKKKFQGLLYLIKYLSTAGFGRRGLEVPPSEMADPWQVVMNRSGIGFFGDQMTTYLTGYGYGGPETPAVFGMRMLDANAIIGAAMSPSIMWENGTQPIWKGVASGLNVRTNSEITQIVRGKDEVAIHVKGVNAPEYFDKVIMAVDPQTTIRVLDSSREERALFSQVKYMPYATFAVKVEGFTEGKAEVGYIKENMTLDRMGRPMAWIKRYKEDNVFIFHLFAPQSMSDAEIMANIKSDMQRLGAQKLTLVDSRRWPFFPHVDTKTMREEHFYERAMNIQGLNNTVFVNEALAMSTMPDAAELGRKSAQRLVSGEYGP